MSENPSYPRRGDAFALVVTLLIVSVLAIVVVGYLSSMSSERQTANAFSAKTRASDAAQAAVDSSMATLRTAFKDFPDSATVWDQKQCANTGTPPSYVYSSSTAPNEGTTLYLRASPTPAAIPATPASPTGVTDTVPDPSPAALAATSPVTDNGANGPNNPNRKTFALPLISGIPGGYARLVSEKTTALSTTFPVMNLAETDPTKQTYVDLNSRRFANDTQGVIGSPPGWTGPEPKPARAFWVNMTDTNGLVSGRYAFWIEDESFRANLSYIDKTVGGADASQNSGSARIDNTAQAPGAASGTVRGLLPGDISLPGLLLGANLMVPANPISTNVDSDSQGILATRVTYPGSVFPERLGFAHLTNGSAMSTPLLDGLRYMTTSQSGTLNMTRHGTERLNLNASTTVNAAAPVTIGEIRNLVESIRYHLPEFGQRFYRAATVTATSAAINSATDVPSTNAEIYLYKIAANLRDYLDNDSQPTMIVKPLNGGNVPTLWNPSLAGTPNGLPTHAFGSNGMGDDGSNYMWAQGKEAAPYLQEAVVRYRPSVNLLTQTYSLNVDYYLEFWNMSDKDVTAASLGNTPCVLVADHQPWESAYQATSASSSTPPADNGLLTSADGLPPDGSPALDYYIDIFNGVTLAGGTSVLSTGVVFKAGSCTVITTDPDCATSMQNSWFFYGNKTLSSSGIYLPNVYYCSRLFKQGSSVPGKRFYTGPLNTLPPTVVSQGVSSQGIMPLFRNTPPSAPTLRFDSDIEVALCNSLGYIDCCLGAVEISAGLTSPAGPAENFDYTTSPADHHADFVQGGTLLGNSTTPSELGDPRTNNEQLMMSNFTSTGTSTEPDQTRYSTSGASMPTPYSLGMPNSYYVKPSGSNFWPDYFTWPFSSATNLPAANPNCDAAAAPMVIADGPMTSIGQLGDLFDPARVLGNKGTLGIGASRGGGRTFKIGQRDDLTTADPSGNQSPYNTSDCIPRSNNWASFRLADVFSIDDPIELPGRININGILRDKGAALRAAMTNFTFQPVTVANSGAIKGDPMIHGDGHLVAANALAGKTFASGTGTTGPGAGTTGMDELIIQMLNRLASTSATGNTPTGPFFERAEFAEIGTGQTAMFGFSSSNTPLGAASITLATGVNTNTVFDRGREEVFRRLGEMICTKGDTFTVYAVGQSIKQAAVGGTQTITGTQKMRVTFRLVPKQVKNGAVSDFHPGYTVDPTSGVLTSVAFDGTTSSGMTTRFARPDRYDIQILEVTTL